MWWSTYATLLVELGNKQNFGFKFYMEDLEADGIIVKLIFEKQAVITSGFIRLRTGIHDVLDDGNEPLGFIKDGKFLDYLCNFLFFYWGPAPWGYVVNFF